MAMSDDHDVRSLTAKAPACSGDECGQSAKSRPPGGATDRPRKVRSLAAHCPLHLGEDVARMTRAAPAIGLRLSRMPLPDKPSRALPAGTPLMIVHLGDDPAPLLRCLVEASDDSLARVTVVVGDDENASLMEELLAAGIAGFIPARFSERAMRGALETILGGESFAPYRPGVPGVIGRSGLLNGTRGNVLIDDYGLTKVEREVLAFAAQGLTNHEIAQRRGGTEGTVKVHMNHIFTKLSVRSRCEAIGVYLQLHNVDTDALRQAQAGHMDMKWLLASMTHEHHPKGTLLFRSGDPSTKFYYLHHGQILLEEIGVNMGPKEVFGEIGIFAPEQRRTCSAVCATDVDVFTLSFEEVERCLLLNPKFTFFLMRLVTERLIADRERFRGALAKR